MIGDLARLDEYDPATGMPYPNAMPRDITTPAWAFRGAGMPGMENYVEAHPEQVFRAYDKAVAARDAMAGAEKLEPLVDLSGGVPLAQQLEQDKKLAGFAVPQTAGDWIATGLMPWRGIGLGLKTALMGLGYGLDSTEAEGGVGRTLAQRRAARAAAQREGRMGEVAALDALGEHNWVPPGIGHNMPPSEFRMSPEVPAIPPDQATPMGLLANTPSVQAMTPMQAYNDWLRNLPTARPASSSTAIPDIRNLPVDQAIEIARRQPHLIKAGEGSEGLYVGGPRELQSKATLNAIRRNFDQIIASDPRGYDWYDRYRAGLAATTNNTPLANDWASKMQGQWSAGVDPGNELNYVLKELNSAIAGMPVKANYPAQHEAFQRALAARDPNLMQLGDKTFEYAVKVNSDQPGIPAVGTATGVNDFRHARNFRYTETSGEPQTGSVGEAGHRFLDYETALAVDRANQMALGGRTDWTGERLQAAPWVVQKAEDLMSRNAALTREEAMQRALRTIVEYFPRQTYYATHEVQPGANVTGHMPGSIGAGQAERIAYAADPASTWATAPGGRDAIYAGLGVPGTGAEMRVRSTLPMQGMYTTPQGNVEFNPGFVARPMGSFNTPARDPETEKIINKSDPFKVATPADRAILNAGEAVRALVDAQNAGAWHTEWAGGPNYQSTSLLFPRQGPATPQELQAIQAAGKPFGMGDVVDTGEGIKLTQFYGGPPTGGKDFDRALRQGVFNQFGEPVRVRIGPEDAGYISYEDKYGKMGSGEATRAMLEHVNQTPELRAAFNANPFIGERAMARLERDKKWAAQWGAPREDIQNLRQIIGQSTGDWVDRVEAALKSGVLLPATAAALFSGALAARHASEVQHAE